METKKSNSKSNSKTNKSKDKLTKSSMQSSQLMKLFVDELKDIYWAEKALTKAIPKMIKKASSEELINALENHLEETKNQVTKLEEVFESIDKKASAKKCDAMAGLIEEAEGIMEECEEGAMCDAGIISGGQKIEHYEIASYGTLLQFAKTLGLGKAAKILEEILNEEKAADEKLSEVATATINIEAAEKKA